MEFIICEMPLGLSLTEILLHLLNFAILFIAMYFLLFKPVKKGIESRKQKYAVREQETAQKLTEAGELKVSYEEKIKNVSVLVDEEMSKARSVGKTQAETLVLDAEKKAKEIIEKGKKNAQAEIAASKSSLGDEVASLSITIASGLLKKEINKSSNDKLIDEALSAWLDSDI